MPADRFVNRPVVLGYHAISAAWDSQLAVSPDLLRKHVAALGARGYVGMTFSDSERLRAEGSLPPRSVVITFDDGYASTLQAAPILAEHGFPGTVFVVTSFVEAGGPLAWAGIEQWLQPATRDELTPLTWSELESLVAAGWEVGSHTDTHPLLTKASDAVLEAELLRSRAAIVRRLGTCTSLAYPYGLADDRVATAARVAGYDAACMLTFAHFVDEPLRRPRVGIGPSHTSARLTAELSRLGQFARRSGAARLARKLHRRRSWLPDR